jgi:hypothetical protein
VKEPCSSDNARQDGEIVKILTSLAVFSVPGKIQQIW